MDDLRTRHIRSFAMRRGHVSAGQRAALLEAWPRWGVEYRPGPPLDWQEVFGRRAPVVLEIGFGMGRTTAEIARANPQIDYLGVEVFAGGVGSLLRLIETRGLTNVRIIRHDAVEVLRDMVAPASLAGINVFFPDPWPKARHHKRRLIQPAFVALLAERLAPGAPLHCATDWEPYALQMREVLRGEPRLASAPQAVDGFVPRPPDRPLTKFEARGLALGHPVHDLVFTRSS